MTENAGPSAAGKQRTITNLFGGPNGTYENGVEGVTYIRDFFNRTMRRSPVSRAKRESRDIELGSHLRRLFKISSGLTGQLLFIVAGTWHRTQKSRYFGHRDGDRCAGSAIR